MLCSLFVMLLFLSRIRYCHCVLLLPVSLSYTPDIRRSIANGMSLCYVAYSSCCFYFDFDIATAYYCVSFFILRLFIEITKNIANEMSPDIQVIHNLTFFYYQYYFATDNHYISFLYRIHLKLVEVRSLSQIINLFQLVCSRGSVQRREEPVFLNVSLTQLACLKRFSMHLRL